MVGSSVNNSDRIFLTWGRIFSTSPMYMIACLWVILVFTSVVCAENNFYTQGRYGKREEPHPSEGALPFFFGSRYGRSELKSGRTSNNGIKKVEISPRPDRFFLGSRYGKRTLSSGVESTGSSRLASLGRLEAVLSYLDRARTSNQHRSKQNYEIQQMYYDNGYDDGNEDNGVENNDSKVLCQSDNSPCQLQRT